MHVSSVSSEVLHPSVHSTDRCGVPYRIEMRVKFSVEIGHFRSSTVQLLSGSPAPALSRSQPSSPRECPLQFMDFDFRCRCSGLVFGLNLESPDLRALTTTYC